MRTKIAILTIITIGIAGWHFYPPPPLNTSALHDAYKLARKGHVKHVSAIEKIEGGGLIPYEADEDDFEEAIVLLGEAKRFYSAAAEKYIESLDGGNLYDSDLHKKLHYMSKDYEKRAQSLDEDIATIRKRLKSQTDEE
jgi:hypothetical protein